MELLIESDPDVLVARFEALRLAAPLLQHLRALEIDVFVVGGGVRDLMLGREPREVDLVVESELDPVLDQLGVRAQRHPEFSTATIELDGTEYDLAMARRERYEHPGALPTVEPAGLDEDLNRRDFTVNAIALAISGPDRGLLKALPGALHDLATATMRVLHDRSFIDDPTRLLRLALYTSRLGFTAEPHTLGLARAAVSGGALDTVSGSRIGADLRRLADEADPVAALAALGAVGTDAALIDGFGARDPSMARAALDLLPPGGDRAAVAIAAACLAVASGDLKPWLTRLDFKASERDKIVAAALSARPMAAALRSATRPSEIATAVAGAPIEAVALAGALGAPDAARRWLSELRQIRLEIDGNDLIDAGVPRGPAIGRGMRAALAAKLDGIVVGREDELAHALSAAAMDG